MSQKSLLLTISTKDLSQIIAISKSRIEVLRKLKLRSHGSEYARLDKRVHESQIDLSHFNSRYAGLIKVNRARRKPLKELLTTNSSYNKQRLKQRLLADNILENKCTICKLLPIWENKILVLILDHINGIHDDDRIENLRIVCPNCNTQLSTHCGRNRKAKSNNHRCPDCNKVIAINSTRCKQCSYIARRKIVNRPTAKQLLKDIKQTNYQATSRKYGVCNATIRKWLQG